MARRRGSSWLLLVLPLVAGALAALLDLRSQLLGPSFVRRTSAPTTTESLSLRGSRDCVLHRLQRRAEIPTWSGPIEDGIRESTQAALEIGESRLDVELPLGFCVGEPSKANGDTLSDVSNLVDEGDTSFSERVAKADRQLARCFADSLSQIGKDLCFVFRTQALAKKARKEWKLVEEEEGYIRAFPEKCTKQVAETTMREMLLKLDTRCLVAVAPKMKHLRLLQTIGADYANQLGIILLNARISGKGRDDSILKDVSENLQARLQSAFKPIYHMRFLPYKDVVLWHQLRHPDDGEAEWVLGKLGAKVPLVNWVAVEELKKFNKQPDERTMEAVLKELNLAPRGKEGSGKAEETSSP